jgi:1-acyl-sn-glycerol-3-phosphate acyltransferase
VKKFRRRQKNSSSLYQVVIVIARWFFKIFYRHKVYGLEHFIRGPAIIAANHASFYDPPLVAVSSPEEVHFLAREGLFKTKGFGWFIRKLNSHPVKGEASDIGVFKTICNLLAEGDKVLLFPEGKRCFHDELSPLKPGIVVLIARSETAILPVYVHGSFQVWNRKRPFPKLFGSTACVFGSPIYWKDYQHHGKKEAQKHLLEKLTQSLQDLRAWYEAGAKGSPP